MTSLSRCTFMHWRKKWQPTPVFLPGESQGWWSLVGCCLWGRTESARTRLKRLSNSSIESIILIKGSLASTELPKEPMAQRTSYAVKKDFKTNTCHPTNTGYLVFPYVLSLDNSFFFWPAQLILRDLSSLTRNQTWIPSVEVQCPDTFSANNL